MSSAVVSYLPNGTSTTASQKPPYMAEEYQKILNIRDQVFAGSHPRLALPAHVRHLLSQQSSTPPIPISQPAPESQQPLPISTVPFSGSAASSLHGAISSKVGGNADSHLPVVQEKNSVSEFDPILLTKSDDLLRAEAGLKRQRLETLLRNQFEQKRLDARKRPALSEAKPDFDISALLAKALEVTKKASPPDAESASDSFDENSFYSSRAPDSTPEGGGNETSSSQRHGSVGAVDVDADRFPDPHARSAVMGSPLSDAHLPAQTSPAQQHGNADMTNVDADDESEEGEYSPPEAMEQYATPQDTDSQPAHNSRDPRNRPLRRYSELEPPSPNGPTRALGKMRRDRGRFRASPLHHSPDDPQNYQPKKKRKLDKRNDKKTRRYGGLSPDAFIKEENISPPPFHDVQPLGAGRIRPPPSAPAAPIVIEDDYPPPPRDRYNEPRYRPASPLVRMIEQVQPTDDLRGQFPEARHPGLSRFINPNSPYREEGRDINSGRVVMSSSFGPDDRDLRRVASMQAMKTLPPREMGEPYYDTPTRARAVSQARGSSPPVREYERVPATDPRVVHSPAFSYREPSHMVELPRTIYETRDLAPPPTMTERIVVDQYGRRFREIIRTDPVSAAPSARAVSVRPGEVDAASYEVYRPQRSSSVYVDPGFDGRYVQEMAPPPRVIYRPVAESSRMSSMAPPPLPDHQHSPMIQRSSSVQVTDRQPAREEFSNSYSSYPDSVRVTSVRPSMMRYNDVRGLEPLPRGQSLQPSVRERSVYVDEHPSNQPRYRLVEPEERYLDPQGREVIMLDGGREQSDQRYVGRY